MRACVRARVLTCAILCVLMYLCAYFVCVFVRACVRLRTRTASDDQTVKEFDLRKLSSTSVAGHREYRKYTHAMNATCMYVCMHVYMYVCMYVSVHARM